jgi:hypothetical protein
MEVALKALEELQPRVKLDGFHRYMVYRSEEKRWISYAGVTSIIGILDKPALSNWKCAEERKHDIGVAHRLPVLPSEELADYQRRFNAAAGKPGAYRAVSDAAASRGHVVHAALEAFMLKRLGKEYTVPEMNNAERAMFKNFVHWEQSHPIKPLYAEARICDDDLMYGGTFDLLCEIDGALVLADFKTSKAGDSTYPEHSIQSGAYRGALMKLGFPPMRGLIIQVDRDGGPTRAHYVEDDYSPAYETFKHLLSTKRYLDERDSLLPPPA